MMLLDDIKLGESDQLEFKETPNREPGKWLKTVIAFANCRGGRIVFGVKNLRKVVGLDGDLFAMKDGIADAVADACAPMPEINVEIASVAGMEVIVLEVFQGRQTPYYIKAQGNTDGVYVRYDATTRKADAATIQELLLDGARKGYDAVACRGLEVDEREVEALCRKMYDEAVEHAPTPEQAKLVRRVTKKQLMAWGVLLDRAGKIAASNAYALLLGSDDLPTSVKCAVFRGTDRAIFVDRHPIGGSIIDLVNEAYAWVLSKLNVGAQIVGTKRVDVFEIPPDVIRELVVNAVVHRQYVDGAASPISIALYDDRFEITSPGGLPRGMTVEKMLDGHSEYRNKVIAAAFEYMFFIEKWGTGLLRVRKYLADAKLPPLEVKDYGNSVRLVVRRPVRSAESDNGGNTGGNMGGNVGGNVGGNRIEALPDQQLAVCRLMLEDPSITAEAIANKLGIRKNTVEKRIAVLKGKGIVVREGGTRGTWKVLFTGGSYRDCWKVG